MELLSGIVTEDFAERNPQVQRTIQIRGDRTLENFHDAIFKAFDREDKHMYEFQIGGKNQWTPRLTGTYILMQWDTKTWKTRALSASVRKLAMLHAHPSVRCSVKSSQVFLLRVRFR